MSKQIRIWIKGMMDSKKHHNSTLVEKKMKYSKIDYEKRFHKKIDNEKVNYKNMNHKKTDNKKLHNKMKEPLQVS